MMIIANVHRSNQTDRYAVPGNNPSGKAHCGCFLKLPRPKK